MAKKKSKSKSPFVIIAHISEDRVGQLVNDMAENIPSGSVKEWRAVARFFQDRYRSEVNRTANLRLSLAALSIADEMRAVALPEIKQWLKNCPR